MKSAGNPLPQVSQNELQAMAYSDALTGLGNRYRLRDKVRLLAAERAQDPAPFTICIANLDGFKPINDLFGAEAGDEILCQVAHRLKACIPDGATVTRHDGDEFAFILPLVFERIGAERIGQMIKDVLSAPYDLGDRNVRLSASFGFAIYPFAGADFEELLKSAETALYRSKRRGRGQITVYSREIAQEMKRATQLEQALRNAIIADAVDVHFQPIVRISDGGVVGFEALARWIDADLGFVSPAVFVPLAEERGFIDALSETLLHKAAEAALSWPRELFLSFNLSSAQLMDPGTTETILATLARVGLDPHRLELEITETAVMTSADTAQRIITDLRQQGVRISLDDFGTGQSSLGRLRDFTFDKVKIDRAFVSRITTDRASEHIVKAIIAMCDGLNLAVVAEGIEEKADADKLNELGCAMGQGYYYGRPADSAFTLRYLQEHYRDFMTIERA
ncbi:putative bifunctional diguanylate cyclase/phosphodiesterase [Neorhizobium galegae]|uniref:putative bifunctional diguanylate cyclase/phosphodiesterase n=1 Tax=Neorhizobium galegae TaxID=399 RepID=UPI000621907F|nr:EAL domain-containing protein [Neorhizobium galegae]CDZ57238.1 Putative diguanylate cyclase/phosphodiesterase (GGDEF and EAL motifs) [Neorhizobium galegae bv. orientalis]KAB1126867.1 EAL domain-containing protein [Neorhizobium galegae]MCQ1808548.1 EAL domain-containing protein [Neorhizobium galegae]UIK06268.1 EAL domain-containing protein [Neorhizobium galegae]CDZ65708.1 Putative diguanylate cyclase/phosphodiesterase (GGDEF and EAL motifs) [Neorhizobium galegae bv. orientalis]